MPDPHPKSSNTPGLVKLPETAFIISSLVPVGANTLSCNSIMTFLLLSISYLYSFSWSPANHLCA